MPNMKIFNIVDRVIEMNCRIKRGMFTLKRSTINSQKSFYLSLKACFEVQDLLAIMEPVVSHYSFLFLQSKYTRPPFKTFADVWSVISMILCSIMSVFWQQFIMKERIVKQHISMRSTPCWDEKSAEFSQRLSSMLDICFYSSLHLFG